MTKKQGNGRVLYIFLDEGGNMDFSPSGTKYFTITSISKERPFEAYKSLCDLKYNLVELGTEIEYFRASEDRQTVRNSVFDIIDRHLDETRIDSLIVEKNKTDPALQKEEKFFPEMLGHLLSYIIKEYDLNLFEKVIVFTDSLPIQKKRKAVEKAIKKALAHKLPGGAAYYIFHHASKSNYDLQIVDYCNWAIYRKWERQDLRSYKTIQRVLKSELDIFKTKDKSYY